MTSIVARDAHHGKRAAVEQDGAAHDGRVAAEPLLPAIIAQDRHRGGPLGFTVARQQGATERGRHGQRLERVGRDDFDPGALRRLALGTEVGRIRHEGKQVAHTLGPLAVILEVRERGRVRHLPSLAPLEHEDEAVGLRHRHPPQHHLPDHAKDGRVDGNAEGEREHHHGGEAGELGELTKGEAEVLDHLGILIFDWPQQGRVGGFVYALLTPRFSLRVGHSARSASVGFTSVARRAGIQQAHSAARRSSSALAR
jgi:hypothetical protein